MSTTCNWLDLQTLGSQPIMPKNLPDHWTDHVQKSSPMDTALNVQDCSLQNPSNAIWPLKIYLSQNNPS